MDRTISNGKRLISAILVGLSFSFAAWAAPESVPQEWQAEYDQGVEAYRDGHFEQALDAFRKVAKQVPESIESRYYLAISLAQMGRFKDARKAYEDIIRLAPESESARLAQQGIEYLPTPDEMDAPPRFQKSKVAGGGKAPDPSDYVRANASMDGTAPEEPKSPFGGMDSEAMQMMMMMSAMGGGGGAGGFNPMMMPLIQSMTKGKNGDSRSTIPPDMMSTMMMNQMMQDFSPFSSGRDNE